MGKSMLLAVAMFLTACALPKTMTDFRAVALSGVNANPSSLQAHAPVSAFRTICFPAVFTFHSIRCEVSIKLSLNVKTTAW
jgi:hypothetical protein